MKNPLTPEQQNRLSNASSAMTREEWNKAPVGVTDQIAAEIDKVILQLHEENPMAFSTIAYYDETLGKVVYTKKSVGMDFYRYGQRK